jgi:hypothetical protein
LIPGSIDVVILLLLSPEIEAAPEGVVVAVVKVLSVELSEKFKRGWFVSVKSKMTFPSDSSQFKIPSLSKSISTLSMIKSLSKSSGHKLTGIITDSKAAPEQTKVPINL